MSKTNEEALAQYLGVDVEDVEESYSIYGLPVYEVNYEEYAVGNSDDCYKAAVEDAKNVLEECFTDKDRVKWFEKWGWPGVDTDAIASDLNDDINSSLEEDEEPYEMDFDEIVSEFGLDFLHWDFIKNYVDMDLVGEFIVDTDGVANSLARYDGREIDLGDDLYAYRMN